MSSLTNCVLGLLGPDSFGAEDTASYLPSWRKLGRNTSHRINQSPWVYHSAEETGTSSVRGRHQTFSGGGYLIPVWSTRNSKMVESLEKLRNASWVDDNTRAVVLEFTVFNPTYNVFASIQLWFEFTNIGVIDSSYHDIAICQVPTIERKRDIYRFLLEAAYFIGMNIYAIKIALSVWKMRHSLQQYFATIWTLVDVPIISLTFACIPMMLWEHVIAKYIWVDIKNSRGRKFISISKLMICHDAIESMMCIVNVLLMMNVFRLSIFVGKRNVLFACNVFRSRQYVPYMAFLFSVIFVMTVLMSQVLFGSNCIGLENFAKAVMYVVSLFRLNVVSSKNECTHDFSSFVNLMLFSFATICVVFMWRLLLLMCGITAQYTPTTRDEKAELQFVDFLRCRLLVGIGYWNMDDYIAHTISLQPGPDKSIGPTREQCRQFRRNLLYRRFHPLRVPACRKQHIHPHKAFTSGGAGCKYHTDGRTRQYYDVFSQI